MSRIVLSSLNHTWLLDLDGTILKHNGYLIDGCDSFLQGSKEFLNSIPKEDMVIFITSRAVKFKDSTEDFLKTNGIRYNAILFDVPYGERILINDKKPSGLPTGISINLERDKFENIDIEIDSLL